MRILEERGYSIDDIINQVKDDLGFTYNSQGDFKGNFKLGDEVVLELEFNEDHVLDSAVVKLKSNEVDLVKDNQQADIILAAIESAQQIVDLFNRMIGEDL